MYAAALLVSPVLTTLVLLIGAGTGWIAFPNFSLGGLGMMLSVFAAGFLPMFFKNIFEEGAWRGYLAPKVHVLGFNIFVEHTIVGLLWGAWHIPYYLFFLDRAYLSQFTAVDLALYLSLVMMESGMRTAQASAWGPPPE